MKGDIALAGFVLTAAEWEALDARSRTQLMAAAIGRDDLWIEAGLLQPDDERQLQTGSM